MCAHLYCFIVRLVNGPTKYEGRVELYHNGEWATVCDNGWDLNNAQVVCSELGLGQAINIKGNGFYGKGSGQILSGSLRCYGHVYRHYYKLATEPCLLTSYRTDRCEHKEDAGVKCSSGCLPTP